MKNLQPMFAEPDGNGDGSQPEPEENNRSYILAKISKAEMSGERVTFTDPDTDIVYYLERVNDQLIVSKKGVTADPPETPAEPSKKGGIFDLFD